MTRNRLPVVTGNDLVGLHFVLQTFEIFLHRITLMRGIKLLPIEVCIGMPLKKLSESHLILCT